MSGSDTKRKYGKIVTEILKIIKEVNKGKKLRNC
jgi:hypothetical protein